MMADETTIIHSPSSSSSSSSGSQSSYCLRARSEEEVTSNKKKPYVLPDDFLKPRTFDGEEVLAPTPISAVKPAGYERVKTVQVGGQEILAPTPISAVKPADYVYDAATSRLARVPYSRQFWKAGDYEDKSSSGDAGDTTLIDGMDHVRVHPRFLHSNATSHKWVLGAIAELLDNSIDEVRNGATYCNIDMLMNQKDGSKMLLVEDDGGGMSPGTMRHCMSLGYSAKSKLVNTIGQYGNGFKTSTMRVGADVIVFSRCPGKDARNDTQSIGLLSYTFLTSTGKEDIVVPMLDYERKGGAWSKVMRTSSEADWNKNVDTIVQWSPYTSEAELLEQFKFIEKQGTRIIIYNLWQDDDGLLELDFESDKHDIQIRGVNRDDKKIQTAKTYPRAKEFLTYTHSLRSYSSILYLKPPEGFRITLRDKDVVHHDILKVMDMVKEFTYKPTNEDGVAGKLGFHKDANHHNIGIQGFNVYHRNRLIKPFWKVWNAASSGGRGVIGVLEANFVKPAHDKQDFEVSPVLQRLENKLNKLQKHYWNTNKEHIGYSGPAKDSAPSKSDDEKARGNEARRTEESPIPVVDKCSESTRREAQKSAQTGVLRMEKPAVQNISSITNANPGMVSVSQECRTKRTHEMSSSGLKSNRDQTDKAPQANASRVHEEVTEDRECKRTKRTDETLSSDLKSTRDRERVLEDQTRKTSQAHAALVHQLQKSLFLGAQLKKANDELEKLKAENCELKKPMEEHLRDLKLEKEKSRSLEAQLKELKQANDEQEELIKQFAEERTQKDAEIQKLKRRIQELQSAAE